jgi:phosphate transport system substrate-binding protein
LVAGFLTALGAANPTVDAPSGDEQIVAGDVHGRKTAVRVATHDAASAFEGLQAGDCQVGMASRRIKPVEVINLRPLGNMLSPNAEHVIGLDGIAVIVNQANPVSSLSVSQLKDIFSGRVTSWSASGGSGTISVLGRDEKSPTFDTLDALVLDRAPLTSGALRFDDSGTLAAAVATRANAIAFTGLSSIGEAKALEITSGGLPIAPTALTVGRETYPLTRRLYLYTAPSPRNPLVTRFIAFAESSAGQKIVDRDGFIGSETSISTASSNARSLPSGAPLGYRRLVDGFDQAKFNFYFNTGSDVLDNKALVDVGRLVEDLSAEARRNKEIVLAGFADSTGDRALNVALSQDRAKSVARELESQGVHVKDTIGFGQELPISDNATEAGREKNRRVEIFVTR